MNNDIIEKVKNAVASTTKKAVKLSADAIDYTKIKLKMAEINSKLDDKYAQIGLAVYDGDENAKIEAICEEISNLKEELDSLKLKLSEYKNNKVCGSCGTICDNEDEFCKGCGNHF